MNEINEDVIYCPICEANGKRVLFVKAEVSGFEKTKKCPECKRVYEVRRIYGN